MLLIYKKALSQAAFSTNPVISFSVLRAKRNSNADRRCCFFFDFRITSNYRPEGSRGNACDRRRGGEREQGLAQRSKKSRKSEARRFFRAPQEVKGNPKDFLQ